MHSSNIFSNKNDFKNVLFVSDLPNDTTEKDLADFFSNYHFTQAKVMRYYFDIKQK